MKDEMLKSQSIVLAVVNATEHLESHKILQMCKNPKVDGHRTLGVHESDIRNYEDNHAVHLRSRVIDQSEVFRDRVTTIGHRWELEGRVPDIDPDVDLQSIYQPKIASVDRKVETKVKEQWIKEVTDMLNNSRTGGLPGFDNGKAIHQVFWRLTDTWKPVAEQHINNIFQCCANCFETVTANAFSK